MKKWPALALGQPVWARAAERTGARRRMPMNNSVDTANRPGAGRPADTADQGVAEPHGVSLSDYRVITSARKEFLDFLLARSEQPA